MRKLLLVSVVLASIVLPWRAASDSSPRRGLRHALLWVVAFNVLYLFALLYIVPRLS